MNKAKFFFNDLARLNKHLSSGYHIGHPNKRIFKDMQKKININKNDIILDMGAGSGLVDRYIVPICKEITLCDIADKIIESAKKSFKKYKNIKYVVADFNEPLPFRYNQFNKIICLGVMQYTTDYLKLIEQLLKILKSNGLIYISPISLDKKVHDNSLSYRLSVYKNIFIKKITIWIYNKNKITNNRPDSRHLTKKEIVKLLDKFNNIEYKFDTINVEIPFAKVKESLVIKKIN